MPLCAAYSSRGKKKRKPFSFSLFLCQRKREEEWLLLLLLLFLASPCHPCNLWNVDPTPFLLYFGAFFAPSRDKSRINTIDFLDLMLDIIVIVPVCYVRLLLAIK